MRSKLRAAPLHFVIPRITASWSKYWKVPPRSGPTIGERRQLVSTRTRLPSPLSTATPGSTFAAPGPLLAMQTPSRPVSRA